MKGKLFIPPKLVVLIISGVLFLIVGLVFTDVVARAQQSFPVGSEATKMGVTAYKVKHEDSSLVVSFTHVNKTRDGQLLIQELGDENDSVLLELRRENWKLSIIWNSDIGDFKVTDAKGRLAHFVSKDLEWIPETPNDQQVLNESSEDIKLIAAIFSDFAPDTQHQSSDITSVQGQSNETCVSPDGIEVSCPCTGVWNRGDCFGESRSRACACATGDVNSQCWNTWCIGCCELRTCDCGCLIEDYFCSCGIDGRECGGPCQ